MGLRNNARTEGGGCGACQCIRTTSRTPPSLKFLHSAPGNGHQRGASSRRHCRALPMMSGRSCCGGARTTWSRWMGTRGPRQTRMRGDPRPHKTTVKQPQYMGCQPAMHACSPRPRTSRRALKTAQDDHQRGPAAGRLTQPLPHPFSCPALLQRHMSSFVAVLYYSAGNTNTGSRHPQHRIT